MQQKIYREPLNDAITLEDLLGKEVIDSGGEFIGIIEKIYLDPKSMEVLGISIDKGFLRKGLEIGKSYIDKITPKAVFLKIRPVFRLKGRTVFDIDGKNVGKVSNVILNENRNQIKSLIIKSVFKETIIDSSFIKQIGHNVFLNIQKEALFNNQDNKEVKP